jgi:hypothetical protein
LKTLRVNQPGSWKRFEEGAAGGSALIAAIVAGGDGRGEPFA